MEVSSEQYVEHARAILKANNENSQIRLRSLSNMGVSIYILGFQEISSTMLLSQKWDIGLLPHKTILVFVAKSQTNGKGQNTNAWHSPPGNIYYTMLTKQSLTVLSQLLPIISISIVETLQETLQLSEIVQIKWQNDVYVNNRKISGTLIKSDIYDNSIVLQIGIGINVNENFTEETTCLRQYCLGIRTLKIIDLDSKEQASSCPYKQKSPIDQDTIESIIDRLSIKILTYFIQQPNPIIVQKYNDRLIWKNQNIKIYDNTLKNVLKSGVFMGINQHCFAILREESGNIVEVSDGRMRKH